MIMVDLFCPECDAEVEDVMINNNEPLPPCDECGCKHMKKAISPITFELKYNNRTDTCDWNGNTTRYWDDIKAKGGDEPSNDKQQKWE